MQTKPIARQQTSRGVHTRLARIPRSNAPQPPGAHPSSQHRITTLLCTRTTRVDVRARRHGTAGPGAIANSDLAQSEPRGLCGAYRRLCTWRAASALGCVCALGGGPLRRGFTGGIEGRCAAGELAGAGAKLGSSTRDACQGWPAGRWDAGRAEVRGLSMSDSGSAEH